MKLMAFACLFLITASTFAQSGSPTKPAPIPSEVFKYTPPGTPETTGQAGCPVVFTNVALRTNAHYMLVRNEASPDPSVAFQYKNQSGKLIASISVRAELKVKESIYDLDSKPVTLHMTLTGKGAEVLPLTMLAYGLNRITLEQVSYVGGTIWNADDKRACSYEPLGSALWIGKLQ